MESESVEEDEELNPALGYPMATWLIDEMEQDDD